MSNPAIKISDCVRHLYIQSINTISSTPESGLRFWLSTSDNYLPVSAKDELFEITFYDFNEILCYLTSDINRLSCASLETITNIKESDNNKKFLAWNLIYFYYSAFYSAHSILKALGFGLVQIDNTIINKIQSKARAYGIALTPISRGIYCIDFDVSRNIAVFYKVNRYNESHKGLWQRFSDFLSVLTGVSVVTGTYDAGCIAIRQANQPYPLSVYSHIPQDDATEVVDRIDDLIKTLNTNGDFNWLSYVRNVVNYNHGYGVWYPYREYHKQYDKILDLTSLCNDNPMSASFDLTGEDGLLKFVKTCQLINAINMEILDDLLNRHPQNKSFLRNKFLAYKKLYMRA